MSRFLAREGFASRTAADGPSGLALARSIGPRAILLDVMMPEMDGWSVLSALKGDPDLADIPVIMVTFLSDNGFASALGASDYVLKPVRWERFKQVMERFRHAAGRVLLVEDDADMRRHLRTTLERDGWQVTEADDGRKALDCVGPVPPALVLFDLDMPATDGLDFLRVLRDRPGCGEIPVVGLTARSLTEADRARLGAHVEVLQQGTASLRALAAKLRALPGLNQPVAKVTER